MAWFAAGILLIAIADTRAKAEAMARAAGITLRKIVAIVDALVPPQATSTGQRTRSS